MHSKNSIRFFTGAYSLARSAGLLNNSWAKTAFVTSYFLYKKFWEDPFWGLVHRVPALFQNGNILDIGANIGYTSCLFADALKPGFKVYSFEPDQANFHMLSEIICRKKLSQRVVPMNSAVGKSDGRIELWHNEEHSGDHRVATDHFKNMLAGPSQIFSAAVVSVDSFVKTNNLQDICFIKIDVQGYELAVCEGMTQTLANFPSLSICCEYAPENLIELGFEPIQLLNYFRANGFQVHILTRSSTKLAPDNATIQRVAAEAGYVDLLCSRQVLS
jgi:FkbM family methyltransferase